ncbi:MAG TPA: hypothetical protein VJV79_26870 [Polyangiaceae bacterium]|nr:hypothetical protein [Polyangiaceae bacterium]
MTERPLEPWLADEHADPELRRLLEAGKNERPRTQALRIAPLVISTLLTVQAAAAVAAPAAEGAARHAITTVILKWFAGGVIVSAATLSASQAFEPAPQAMATVVQRALPAAPPRLDARPAPLPAVEPASPAPEPSAAPVKALAVRADVAREVVLLDAARAALLQGDARRALETLAGLDRLPARALLPEATVLRVRALLALNDLKTARKVAAQFVATAPGSPQAPVLRGLFAESLETKTNDSPSVTRKSAIQTEASEL